MLFSSQNGVSKNSRQPLLSVLLGPMIQVNYLQKVRLKFTYIASTYNLHSSLDCIATLLLSLGNSNMTGGQATSTGPTLMQFTYG